MQRNPVVLADDDVIQIKFYVQRKCTHTTAGECKE